MALVNPTLSRLDRERISQHLDSSTFDSSKSLHCRQWKEILNQERFDHPVQPLDTFGEPPVFNPHLSRSSPHASSLRRVLAVPEGTSSNNFETRNEDQRETRINQQKLTALMA